MDTVRIDLEPIKLRTVHMEIEGVTSLLVHKFSDKARKQIQDKQGGKVQNSKKKEIRKPEEEFNAARHTFVDEHGELRDGYPAIGIKKAMIDAGYRYVSLVKADLRGDMHINCDLVAIDGPPPEINESMVRLSGIGRTADVRYRPEYWPWSMVIPITFKPSRLSEEQIVAMLAHAGFSVGLGEHRPERDGNNGRFEVRDVVPDSDSGNGGGGGNNGGPKVKEIVNG